jgi:hypothetical protein
MSDAWWTLNPPTLATGKLITVLEPIVDQQIGPLSLTATAHRILSAFRWPKALNLSKVHFNVRSISGTPTARVDLWALDEATRLPTGSTLANGSVAAVAGGNVISISYSGWTLNNPYCLVWQSTVASTSITPGLHPTICPAHWFTRRSTDSVSSYQPGLLNPVIFALEFSDGSIAGFPSRNVGKGSANAAKVWGDSRSTFNVAGVRIVADQHYALWAAAMAVEPKGTLSSTGDICIRLRDDEGVVYATSDTLANSTPGLSVDTVQPRLFTFADPALGNAPIIYPGIETYVLLEQTLVTGGDLNNYWQTYGVDLGNPAPGGTGHILLNYYPVSGSAWGGPYTLMEGAEAPWIQLAVTPLGV